MQAEVLSPGVQDGDETDPCAQAFGIGGDLVERLCDGVKQHAVHDSLVGQGQRVECIGQGENNMEVLDGKQFFGAVRHPLRAGNALTLGTVPVAAGVVGDAPVLALVARFDVTTQGRGAAGDDGAQDAPLLAAKGVKAMAVASNHIRQLQRGTLECGSHGKGGVGVDWGVGA